MGAVPKQGAVPAAAGEVQEKKKRHLGKALIP